MKSLEAGQGHVTAIFGDRIIDSTAHLGLASEKKFRPATKMQHARCVHESQFLIGPLVHTQILKLKCNGLMFCYSSKGLSNDSSG